MWQLMGNLHPVHVRPELAAEMGLGDKSGYSKHEFTYIPMAAVHINTSTLRVQFSLFLSGPVSRQPIRVSM